MRDKQLLDLARPAGGGCGAARILTRGRARLGAAATVVALAFVVALAVKRSPPRFAAPPIAIVRDTAGDALWSVRLAVTAHEISADRLAAPPQPGPAWQLWLATPAGARSLGLMPRRGRAVIPEMPALVAKLARSGELLVSREPPGGSPLPRPSGPVVFRAGFRPPR